MRVNKNGILVMNEVVGALKHLIASEFEIEIHCKFWNGSIDENNIFVYKLIDFFP